MPIKVASEIRVFSEQQFHALAEKIIGITFDVHNDFGRLLDEEIYKQTIRARCESAGIVPARSEVEIKVCHEDFEKSLYMDLLFCDALMVEAKTVEKLTNAHHAQAIQYLLLTGMQHGLLVNLRPGKVEKKFISTTLDLESRREYVIHDSDWTSQNEAGDRFRRVFEELLSDWGAFLQTSLYREAIVHLFGGPEAALQRIPIYDGESKVGTHEVCLLQSDTALAMTALKDGKDLMHDHLRRFLGHTKLSCLQWVNMDQRDVEFRTLVKELAE